MHLAARIKETSTTTGTGNLTTASVTNFRTGDGALGANVRYPYYIEHESDGSWESGVGYKSDATTFVRERVTISSGGRGVSVSFAAGTKTIFCEFNEHNVAPAWPGIRGTNKDIGPANVNGNRVSAMTATVDRLYYFPFELRIGTTITHLCVSVDTAVAASKARLGWYRMGLDGNPDNLLLESADVDTTTVGDKIMAVTNTFMPPGWYFAACAANAAVGYLASSRVEFHGGPLGNGGRDVSLYQTLAAGWTALPATAAISGVGNVDGGTVPGVYLRGTL